MRFSSSTYRDLSQRIETGNIDIYPMTCSLSSTLCQPASQFLQICVLFSLYDKNESVTFNKLSCL